MSKYAIGQILFVILTEGNRVLPCQVVEENIKKTLSGDEITYKVSFGNEQKNVMELSTVKGEIFNSIEAVQRAMMDRVTKYDNKHIAYARKAAETWYNYGRSPGVKSNPQIHDLPDIPEISTLEQEDLSEPMEVELPDGRTVKANIKGL